MAPRLIRSFLQAVGLMHRGKVEQKLDTELAKVLEAVEQHPEEKATGSVAIIVTVTKLGDRLDIKPKVETKVPKEKDFPSTTFWMIDGALSLEHPDQADMFATREVQSRRSEPA
ncbi:hypothetical protein V5F41_12515 [Xanthobacter autotrophicus]|uniref:hypothetical protein n=1 Tax=Xanthobacter autotrophicus TaxID=280 RepID=UPI00372C7825